MAKSQKSSSQKNPKAKNQKKLSKSENSPNFDIKNSGLSFLTPKARSAFNRLWLAFIEALFLWHFDLECHIWIKTNALGYAISDVLSQLASGTRPYEIVTKTNLSQWYPIVFISRKMIPAETWYKIHDGKLLTIVKASKYAATT